MGFENWASSSGTTVPTKGMGCVSGEILWLDGALEWAVCEDGFWWTPAEE
jgi:hypothetical protein